MEFLVERRGNSNIVKFIGNMDVHGVHKIEKNLMNSINKVGSERVIIDLSNVAFISSAGLRILVGSLKKIHELGGTLTLCGLNPPVEKVFAIVDMNSMFSITKTLDEALL